MASTITTGKKPPASGTIPSELIFEILTRLPGKPVARFKCVCNDWLSMIRSSQFRKAYRSRNRGLIMYWCENIAHEKDEDLDPDRRLSFFYSSLRRLNEPPPADFSPLLDLKVDKCINGVTQDVNGLICCCEYIPGPGDGVKLTLHDVFTGEKMKIPDPQMISGEHGETDSTYHLGYSPMTGEYKILRLVFQFHHYHNYVEVFNLPLLAQTIVLRPSDSDSAWKTIEYKDSGLADLRVRYNMVSHYEVRTFPEDGVLCWFQQKEGLILFNFYSEIFWRVKFPEEVHHQHRERVFVRAGYNGCRSLALYVLPLGEKPECFVLDDYENDDTWRKEDVEFPADIRGMKGGFGVADGDLMLLLMGNQESKSRLVYGYGDDKSVERFMVGKLPTKAKPLDLSGRVPGIHHSLILTFGARLSCLHDSSVLYRSINDVLTANSRQ